MVDLWNALVEIERGARGQYQKIMQNDPAITETSAKISAVLCEQASLIARRTKMRASGQGKSYIAPINESLADLGGKLRELRRTAASLSKQVRVRVKNELRSVESSRRAEVKLARQGSGLWWGNYNAVVNAYEQARSRALREGGEIRAKTFDGSGRITNQIQGGMSVADLFGGGHSQVTVRCSGAQSNCGGGAIEGVFRRTIGETGDGLRRTFRETGRTIGETDARSSEPTHAA